MAFKRGVQSDGSWHVYAGDRNKERWEFTADGTLRDMSDHTIKVQAREKDTDQVVAMTAEVDMSAAAGGVVWISWDGEAQVRPVLDGKSTWQGIYDMQVLEPGQSLPETVVRAPIYAQMDITRDEPEVP